jgi:acyl-coenzyme A thioesterase PaaI-like protein
MDIWQQILDFEPFLRLLDIQAEVLGPDDVVLRLPPRQEIADSTGQIVTTLSVECLVLPRS